MIVLLTSDYITLSNLEFMDSEHLSEIHLINRLYEILHHDLLIGIVYPEVKECLERLVRETRDHFAHEEKLMEERNYPELVPHRRKHLEFMKVLETASEEFIRTKDRKQLRHFMEEVLRDWFIKHLRTEDRRLAEFSRQARSRPT
ncbi:MAG TPA: hemerythrin family protein [Gammaproteobacteria bacterium]|nr:hemerythrin family protein [Gammaproteobacteria bacterium]